jgi:predicted ATPase/class 3 adenylate cyclase
MVCPSCGQENPGVARFCLACGSPLEQAPVETRRARKTVTVVFADVTGSTALGETIDPESLQQVMGRYFAAMRAVLKRHGGTVEKFIGDAVVGVFGIPVVHEDDALRAVRAAGEMRDDLAALNVKLERERGVTIAVRTGVNTGEVIAGDPGSGASFATGDATNVAARLEQAAQPGEILLGPDTYRLVRDAVEVEVTEPLTLKGKAEPFPAFRLLTIAPDAPGRLRRLDSPLVGRERERARLRQAFEHAVTDGACHLFTVLGAAGVGKSRLVEEFLRDVGDSALVVRGRCLPYGEGITFWPALELVKDAAAIVDEDSPDEARAKISLRVSQEPDAELVADRLADLLGLGEAAGAAEETFWAVRRLLEALAVERPVVALLDDIHWAAPALLDLIEHVADWSRDASIVILCLARPELLDERPTWGGGKLHATTVLLEPLPDADCHQLMENLLGPVEGAVGTRVVEVAEGNPLFVEELLAMLVEDGMLARQNGGWAATAAVDTLEVPATINTLLAARLDRLAADERHVIERASVIGKIFERGAVVELAPEPLRATVPTHLLALVRKEMIRPDRSTLAEEAYRFRSILLRDAAYDALPKEVRAELHERFAVWLEQTAGERSAEYDEIVGYHLEQAVRLRQQLGGGNDVELGRRGAERLALAGRRARARGDDRAAANLLQRAAALLPSDDRSRGKLMSEAAEALLAAGDFAGARRALDDTAQAAARAGDERVAGLVAITELMLKLQLEPEGVIDEAVREGERLIARFQQSGDDRGVARALMLRAMGFWMACRFESAREAYVRALEPARRAGEERMEYEVIHYLASAELLGPLPVAEALRNARELMADVHGPLGEAGLNLQLGPLLAMTGDIDEGRALVASAKTKLRDVGAVEMASAAGSRAAFIEAMAGDWAAAEREAQEGYDPLQAIGDKSYLSTAAGELAVAVYEQGRDEEAERLAAECRDLAASEDVISQILWRSVRGRVLARRGQAAEGEALLREALALVEQTDMLNEQGATLLGLADVLVRAGRVADAREATAKALRRYERKGNVVSAERARAALAALDAP